MMTVIFKNSLAPGASAIRNADKPKERDFTTAAIKLSSNCIYGLFNDTWVPIAHGTGDTWRVGNDFYNSVDCISVNRQALPRKKTNGRSRQKAA